MTDHEAQAVDYSAVVRLHEIAEGADSLAYGGRHGCGSSHGEDYGAAFAAMTRAVLAGLPQAQIVAAALEAHDAAVQAEDERRRREHERLAQEAAARTRRRSVPCPRCGAEAGHSCVTEAGRTAGYEHTARGGG